MTIFSAGLTQIVIRPCWGLLDYFLRSFGFYKMPFACF